MMKQIVIILVVAGCTFSAFTDKIPPELKNLQANRAKEIKAINDAYVKALEKLKIKYTKRGDLESAIAINNELMLFSNSNQTGQIKISERTTNTLEIDITQRSQTDPLLVIDTHPKHGIIPGNNYIFKNLGYEVQIQSERTPPSYKELWRKEDVFVFLNYDNKPGIVDFSNITLQSEGILEISARNHPKGSNRLTVFLNNEEIEEEKIDGKKWARLTIKYDHESVILKSYKLSPSYGQCFLSYSIKK